MIYTYFARDYFNNSGNFPMTKEHFSTLLEVCAAFSEYFSLRVNDYHHMLLNELANWRVLHDDWDTLFVCKVCKESINVLQAFAESRFDLSCRLGNGCPEDLSFYRPDKSVFMDSIAHEGECSIYPRENEDVGKLLSFDRWLPCDDQGRPEIPAKLVHMEMPSKTDIQNEPFYLKLKAIQQEPNRYLPQKSIEALSKWIDSYWPESFGYKPTWFPNKMNALPTWYFAFKMGLLAKYDALTTTTIPEALCSKNQDASRAFDDFFCVLDCFVQKDSVESR